MNHAELSRRLALAIGWLHTDIEHDVCRVGEPMWSGGNNFLLWKKFDYRDPTVALPVLKWLITTARKCEMFQRKSPSGFSIWLGDELSWIFADTLEEAIARAAVAVGETR